MRKNGRSKQAALTGFVLALFCCLFSQGVHAQPIPVPKVTYNFIWKNYDVTMPNGDYYDDLSEDELTELMEKYGAQINLEVIRQLANPGGGGYVDDMVKKANEAANGQVEQLKKDFTDKITGALGGIPGLGGGNGFSFSSLLSGGKDEIDTQLEEILGNGGSISDMFKEQLKGMMDDMMGSIFGSTPIGEVSSLKKMMKEANTKQQKIDYQDYKTAYEQKQAMTSVSPQVKEYYKQMDMPARQQGMTQAQNHLGKLLAMPAFSAQDRATYKQTISKIMDIKEDVADINVACNLKEFEKKPAFMTSADRMKVIDEVAASLDRRKQALAGLHKLAASQFLAKNYEIARNASTQSLYKVNTAINRSIKGN